MANLFSMFKDLSPQAPLQVGTVESSSGDTHQVTLLDGSKRVLRGKAMPGNKVFLKGDVIQGVAPDLTLETIDV